MNKFIQDIIPGVISGIIVSILIFIFSKPLRKFGLITIEFLEGINKGFRDFIYYEAAKKNYGRASLFNSYLITLIYFIGSIIIISDLQHSYQRNLETNKQILELIENHKSIDNNISTKEDNIEKIKNDALQLKEKIKNEKPLIISLIVGLFAIVGVLFINYARITKINSLHVEFNQILLKIRPYITDEKYNKLNMQWAYMKSKEDWKSINNNLESIFKELNLEKD